MDKGQHLRLVFVESNTNKVIALSTEMTLHLSAQTEDSTTKDTTDTNGDWNEYDVTQRSGDIQFSALIGVGTDANGKSLADWIDDVKDEQIPWKLVIVNSTNNRNIVKTVCSGNGKLSNLQMSGQNRQKATYSGTLNIYGPVDVGTD
jgi:predicted secreted protein